MKGEMVVGVGPNELQVFHDWVLSKGRSVECPGNDTVSVDRPPVNRKQNPESERKVTVNFLYVIPSYTFQKKTE